MGQQQGRILRQINRRQWHTMPWKNGGGITHELLRVGEGREGWALRLSMAEVNTDGPFSRFPGVDRVILLLKGAGFVLHRNDGLQLQITQPFRPFSFLGEDVWDCRLLQGPVLDFNVMTDRSVGPVAVWSQGPGEIHARYFLCLESGVVEGREVEALDLLECEGALASAPAGIGIR